MVDICNSCRVDYLFEVAPKIKIHWGQVREPWCPFYGTSSPNPIFKIAIQPISHMRSFCRILKYTSPVTVLLKKKEPKTWLFQSPYHTTTFGHECSLVGSIQCRLITTVLFINFAVHKEVSFVAEQNIRVHKIQKNYKFFYSL